MLAFDDPLPFHPTRVIVVGVSGAGKSTLAARIAPLVGGPHIEIDGLYHGPNWTPREEFMADVEAFVRGDAWVTEWQYSAARPLLAEHADLAVWLDLPFVTVTLPRLVRRTLRRRLRGERLWNGNVEPPLRTFFTDRNHIVRWAVASRNKCQGLVSQLEQDHPCLSVVRLRSQREVEDWLSRTLARATG